MSMVLTLLLKCHQRPRRLAVYLKYIQVLISLMQYYPSLYKLCQSYLNTSVC